MKDTATNDTAMNDTAKNTKRQPVFRVQTHLKAGYYVGLVGSAGTGSGATM
jgi:hypothetical protein